MDTLAKIKGPVEGELKEFNRSFRDYLKSKAPLLNIITSYVIRNKGKQMRPLFVLLTAKQCGGITPSSYNAASLIELMHTATLIHDDVVDESYERRGIFSVNALWRNKIAVLVGDFLLAKGLLLAVDNSEHELLRIVSDAVREMSEGELLQIQKARKLDISEELYTEIIRKKTAVLIASCAACGAKSSGAGNETVEKMYKFGEAVGMAFQVRDDLFDYYAGNKSGKPAGNDIREKKVTLPLIYALRQSPENEKKAILRIVKRGDPTLLQVNEVVEFVKKYGGFEYSTQVMDSYRNTALEILHSMPSNDATEALVALVHYTTSRDK
jgi:octaprenyl-diphosphate synthase